MRNLWLLLRKDLRILRRSPVLLGLLVSYPIVIAVLVGLVAGYANAKPRVAFVDEDNLPPVVDIAGEQFGVTKTIAQIARNVELVRMDQDEARRELDAGKVVGDVHATGGAVCFATQNVEEVAHASRVIALQDGRVVGNTVGAVFG